MSSRKELEEIVAHLTKRKELAPLDFFKNLDYQDMFEKCPVRIKGVFGGNRAGKTQIGAKYVIQKCLAKPNQRWWAVAETEEVSIAVQQRKIWELLPKEPGAMRYCHYDEVNGFRNNKVIFADGSRIVFKYYAQGRAKFQGDDLDGIWNDEEPPVDIYREQKMRLLDRGGEMIFTMTALLGITELMQDLFEEHDVLKSQYAPLIEETLPRIVEKNGARFFMLWTTENPYIEQAVLEEDLKLMERAEIRSRIYGIPSNMAGKIYPKFNKLVHVIKRSQVQTKGVCIWNVLDPHDRKPWAINWWVVDKTNTAYCVREYPWRVNFNDLEFDDKTYDDYAALIKNVELDLVLEFGRTVSKRIIDPNFGNKTVQLAQRTANGQAHTTPVKELAKRGLHYKDAIDALEAGHLSVRKNIHYVEKDGQIIVQPKMLWVDECENSIRHMSRYSRKDIETTDGDTKDRVAPKDKYKDFPDLARYLSMANFHYIARLIEVPREQKKFY